MKSTHQLRKCDVTEMMSGGMRLCELYDHLSTLTPPLALQSVPSVDEQTVAGVCGVVWGGVWGV